MRAKTFATSLSTVLIVSAVGFIWAVAAPSGASCASAWAGPQIVSSPSESAAMVSELNKVRAAKGLGALSVDGNLSSVAQSWAVHMAEAEGLSHRSNLAAGVTIDWRLLGENVGRAPAVDQMMTTFINSPTHYKNIVEGQFNYVGIGTVRTPDGLLYTAHEFAYVKPAAAPAPAAAPSTTAKPAPAPAPAKVVAQQSSPVITAPATAPAPSTTAVPAPAPSTTVTTETVTVDHSFTTPTKAAPKPAATPVESHTGC